MKILTALSAGMIASIAGMSIAQPVVDGVYDPGTEGALYTGVIWLNDIPTGFGDNQFGDQLGGEAGNPEAVTTGTEIRIPLASLGNPSSMRIAGWINSGDRTFLSNQILHDGMLPLDTGNIGGIPDWDTDPRFPSNDYVTVSSFASGTPVVDGVLDAAYGAAHFIQTNYTGFGDNGDATEQGGGGSEIDGLYIAADATDLYIFMAGNIEANGNALDLYIDTDNGATGATSLGSGSGVGAFIIDAQSGMTFDAGFAPNYVLSVDSEWVDPDRFPRAHFGVFSGNNAAVDSLGTLSGYGAANAGMLTGGDAGINASLAINNSNIEGVGGSPVDPTPAAPDVNWAYGSELNNARVFIDEPNNKLYLFLAGNLEVNYNKLMLFFDTQPGGQNVLLDTNVDISFNGLNGMSNIAFDTGFEPDYWLNINNGQDGAGGLQRYTDAAVLRTNGALIDPFFGVIIDYGSYDGGDVNAYPTIPFAGPRIDIQDGSLGSLFANYGPRLSQLDPLSPIDNLIQVAVNNSNVDGVSGTSADGAYDVNTGIEVCIDLDELGWDGSQDILVSGFIVNNGWDYVSNQVLGGIPGPDNIGPRDADADGVNDLDFSLIAGDQFLNLTNPTIVDPPNNCPADMDGDNDYDFFDVSMFLQAFGAQQPAADFNNDGNYNFFDVSAFLGAFAAGCP